MRKSPWELLIDGDKEAFFIIYQSNYQDLFTYGFSQCGDKELTKDCLQDLFLELWNNRSQLNRDVTNIKSYLFTWLRRKIAKELSRVPHSNGGIQEENGALPVELPYETLLINFQQTAEDKQRLTAALSKLTGKQLEIIKLRFYNNLSYDQISEKTSLTTRTVYNHIYEAIKQLRTALSVLWAMLII